MIRYQFDYIPKSTAIGIDTLNRTSTQFERDLISIWQDTRKRTSENIDKFFTFYENTALNFIPIISGNEKKVFAITAPQITGVVIIGNDYILTYDRKNNLKSKAKIHNSMLQFSYKSEDGENQIESTFHSHVIADYITSTDICTLLLYRDYVEWKQHIVISDKEVSIFNLQRESLFTMKRKAWEKISNRRN